MDTTDSDCLWYAVGAYQRLSNLKELEVLVIANECSELSLKEPVWSMKGKVYHITYIDTELSGLQVVAYFAAATDILSGYQLSDKDMSFKWLKSAKMLANKQSK